MSNRLAAETSPYLQQHADNPVDWFAWGGEALELARSLDKPILLSIGYSACHWCHVMAHESFEDPDVAAEMNRHFVNIKVDREERPDLDQIYQAAHYMLTRRSGGWPLTVFLAPDGTPFFAGTFFPKTPRYGMPGFRELLPRIADAYARKRAEIAQQNEWLLQTLGRMSPDAPAGGDLQRAPIDHALRELAGVFDDVDGGIGDAPKFPHAAELAFCLRCHALEGNELARTMATLTLTKMAEGGIYDQLAGGFCRYSTDRSWTIPHFEKMLYDNGPLLALYTDSWLVTRDPLYEKVVRETAGWIMREMQSPDGGYYSSLDADSEGVEGKFYVWTRGEAEAVLTPGEYAVAARHFGLDGPPNFEGRHWHLRVATPVGTVAQELGLSVEECETRLETARAKLQAARAQRVHPATDDKVLTSWNALAIKAMARAGRVFGCPAWVASARSALEFIRQRLWRDGRLLATYRDGRAHLNAYLDDHAFLLDALLELMQAEFRRDDLDFARALAAVLLEQFEDSDHGGFYFVRHDHEQLILRPKAGQDGATPSGNGVAAYALQRLGHVMGEPRYLQAAERTLRVFLDGVERQPGAHTTLLTALEETLVPPRLVVLRGAASELPAWQARLASTYRPDTIVLAIAEGIPGLPSALDKQRASAGGPVSAWVCSGVTCLPPVFELAGLEQVLATRRLS
ncbi:MAG TPA: thioredoxin domain-containing protein [Burkholderiales bacterium]|nr:thioredoxin domain-containing protein [Burkholderiales bacterium]